MADLSVCEVCGGVEDCRPGCDCGGCRGAARDAALAANRSIPVDLSTPEHFAHLYSAHCQVTGGNHARGCMEICQGVSARDDVWSRELVRARAELASVMMLHDANVEALRIIVEKRNDLNLRLAKAEEDLREMRDDRDRLGREYAEVNYSLGGARNIETTLRTVIVKMRSENEVLRSVNKLHEELDQFQEELVELKQRRDVEGDDL